MRFPILIILMLSIAPFGVWSQSAEKTKQQVLDSVKLCCSNALEIIKSEEAKNIRNYMDVGERTSLKEDFIGKMGTTVHECLHNYDNQLSSHLDWDANSYPIAYFIDNGIVISFTGKRLFKTEKLHSSFFPKDVKGLFRYGTYVFDKSPSSASSNQWGIYGLMEEFNAYYHDMQAQIEYYQCHQDALAEGDSFSNEMNAYYEFNIFMAYYIQYAEKYEKETFKYLMDNRELRTAYTLMETNWRALFTEVFSNKEMASLIPELKSDRDLFTRDLELVMEKFMLPSEELVKYKKFLEKRPIDMAKVESRLDWAAGMSVGVLKDYGISNDELEDLIKASNGDIDLEFEYKEKGYHYVTILVTEDINHLMMTYLAKVMSKYPNAGAFDADNSMVMHLFVNKFKDLNQAKKMADSIKKDFPEVRVE